ncbi:MAG: UDP-N-acetylmuramoyl-tripeptide--D-alanyl-D-alanine ligase [Verrucomicrobiota bacterium]
MAAWSGGVLEAGSPTTPVAGVQTDTRALVAGEFFVALRGENFDGHAFVETALQGGAAAVMVDQKWPGQAPPGAQVIRVEDTLLGLQRLAAGWREGLSLRVIAITGSNGKTSTKDLVASVLHQAGPVNATRGNLNNHIGVPLTLLKTSPEDCFGVWEMGMNHPGEIAPLAAMAKPDVALVTNVGTAHIEFFADRAGIAREKHSIFESLSENGLALLQAEDDFTPAALERLQVPVRTVGLSEGAEVRATDIESGVDGSRFHVESAEGRFPVELPLTGRHMVGNALFAAAIGLHEGLSLSQIQAGLASVQLTPGRMQAREVGGLSLIDDCYNANRESVLAALETLSEMKVVGRRAIALGELAELGAHRETTYQELLERALAKALDRIYLVGPTWEAAAAQAPAAAVRYCPDLEALVSQVRAEQSPEDLLLVKGSRRAALERLFHSLALD